MSNCYCKCDWTRVRVSFNRLLNGCIAIRIRLRIGDLLLATRSELHKQNWEDLELPADPYTRNEQGFSSVPQETSTVNRVCVRIYKDVASGLFLRTLQGREEERVCLTNTHSLQLAGTRIGMFYLGGSRCLIQHQDMLFQNLLWATGLGFYINS